MNMLVCYDIADPRRLSRVAKILEDYGQRVQKSVFEVHVGRSSFRIMKRRIDTEIEPAEDGVKYFCMCRRCSYNAEFMGVGAPLLHISPCLVF
jgi:CRISPR-associated protein Cas2